MSGKKKTKSQISVQAVVKRSLIIFVPLAVLVVGVAMALYYADARTERIIFETNELNNRYLQQELIDINFRSIVSDLMVLIGHSELQMMLENDETRHRKALANEFLVFCDKKRLYNQIMFLDETGMEVIRVNFNDGVPTIVPKMQLQSKANRYYFKELFRLERGDVYVSPIGLNIEGGEIEQPPKSIIRFGTPVFDSHGRKRGVVILNYLGSNLIDKLNKASANAAGQVMLLNSDGLWIHGPKPEGEWGFMSGNERTFGRAFPEAWRRIIETEAGQFHLKAGLFTFTTVYPLRAYQKSIADSNKLLELTSSQLEAREYHWKIVSHVSPDILTANSRNFLSRLLLFYAGLITIMAIGSWFLGLASVNRKRTEIVLRDSERRFRSVMQSANDAIIAADSMGNLISWNKGAQTIFGFREEEVLGQPLTMVIPKRYRDAHRHGLKRMSSTGEHVVIGKTVELHGLRKDGTEFPLELSLATWKTEQGTFYSGIIRDITERKRVEAALTAQKNLLQQVVEQSADGIVVIEPDFNFLLYNDFAEKTLNIGRTEPKNEECHDTYGAFESDGITPLQVENFPHIRALKGETVRHFEMVIRNAKSPDGRIISGNASPLKNDQEQIIGAVGTFHDITRNKKAEDILQKAHLETEQLLASISSVLIGVDANDRIARWNEAAERMFELAAENVVGKSFPQCGITWNWIELFERIAECRDIDRPVHLHDIRFTRPDGKEGFLDITVSQILKEQKVHAGYLLLVTEITERKNLESQLSNAQKLESIGQLAAGIAHEINTPIQYVGDNTHFLNEAFGRVSDVLKKSLELLKASKENSVNPTLVDEMESIIEDNNIEYILNEIPPAIQETLGGVERVANIVQAMKEFSHPGNEEKTLTDINKALDSTITVSRSEWKYVAEMEKDFSSSIPLVPCLPSELNQVFLNLIVNAAHAIADAAKKGTENMGKIRVSTDLKEDSVEVRISDTGTGIPPEIRKKVFDPFFTTKEVGKGTGQGLAISHNVVKEKHGGELIFETEIGKGTTFIVRLPLNDSKG